jgi:flagellar basal body rod protein FlgG
MNRGIFSLASGMVATQQAMDLVSNNLANVNTGGFKQDRALFNDALEKAVSSPDGTQIGTLGSGATIKEQYTDQTQGAIRDTGNQMDFAIQGKGMFATMNSAGQVLYTRDGSFARSATGDLVTSQGDQVLDSNLKPIQLRPGPIAVSADGSISSTTDGGDTYAKLGIFNGTFSKGGSGRYTSTDATSTTAQVKQGSVESSNVNPITTMVEMISLGRNFDMAQKSMQAEDDMTQRLTSTLS